MMEKIIRGVEEFNILPLLEPFTRIDDNVRDINRKLSILFDKVVNIVAEVRGKPTSEGLNDILVADISRYKTKTVTIKLSTPMDIYIYLYDYEKDLDYTDPYIEIPHTEVDAYKTITVSFSDLYRFIRIVVKPMFGIRGDVLLCSVKGSLN